MELIFKKFLELGTISELLKYLIKAGIRNKKYTSTRSNRVVGGSIFSHTSLHRLLTNLSYTGKLEINKSYRHLDQLSLPEEKQYKVVKAQWPALISEDLFNDAQDILEANKRRSFKNHHIYRLSGVLYCGLCQRKLVGQSSTGSAGINYFYYGHNRDSLKKEKRCELERIPASKIEEMVVSRLTEISQDRKLLSEIINQSQPSMGEKKEFLKSLIGSKEQERRRVTQEREGLLSLVADAKSDESRKFVLEKLETLTQSHTHLSQEIEGLKQEKSKLSEKVINLEDYFALLQSFRSNCSTEGLEDQKRLLEQFIKRIVVTKERLVLEYYGKPRTTQVIENNDIFNTEKRLLKTGTLADTSAYSITNGGDAGPK